MTFEQMLVGVLVPAVVGAVGFMLKLSGAARKMRTTLEERGVRIEAATGAIAYPLTELLPEYLRSPEWSARVSDPAFSLLASEGYPIATWRSAVPIAGRWMIQKSSVGIAPRTVTDAGLKLVEGGKLLIRDCAVWSDSDERPSAALIAWCMKLRKGHAEWRLLCDRGTFYWFCDDHGEPCSYEDYCEVVRAVDRAAASA